MTTESQRRYFDAHRDEINARRRARLVECRDRVNESRRRREAPLTDGAANRFWSKVDAAGDCWLWTGAASGRPGREYGQAYWRGGMTAAHRVAWELLVGPIPDGLTLDHRCLTPRCINPDHLEPVTQRENILRGHGACAQRYRAARSAA